MLQASKQEGKKRQGEGKSNSRGRNPSEFVLKMQKRDKQCVMTQYPNHVEEKAKEFKREQKKLRLYSNANSSWRSSSFKHPSTFDTLAMDPELKAAVKADLDKFKQSEKYFFRVGRALKARSPPPVTGRWPPWPTT